MKYGIPGPFRFGDFLISLDEVRDLGNFIELEITVKDSRNYQEKIESIFKFIAKLGIKRESTIRKSYLEMILASKFVQFE